MYPLKEFSSTFRETSFDKTKGVSLIDDTTYPLINLDELADTLGDTYREGENPSSADALLFWNEKLLVLEFKNQKLSQIERRRIRKKAFDTPYLLSFIDHLDEVHPKYLRKKLVFVLIYRENDIPSFSSFRNKAAMLSKTQEKEDTFGLRDYTSLYSSLHTMTADTFWTILKDGKVL